MSNPETKEPGIDDNSESSIAETESSVPVQAISSNYIVRHWNGDLSLGISWWVNGVMLQLLISALIATISNFRTRLDLRFVAVAILLLIAFEVSARLWQVVGIWRSAGKHVYRGGQNTWAVIARVILVMGTVKFLTAGLPVLLNSWSSHIQMLNDNSRMSPITIQTAPTVGAIYFGGDLRAGSASALQRALKNAPQARTLNIESQGGWIDEANKMAALVRQHHLSTSATGQCASAATIVFLAGHQRILSTNAQIGFHQMNEEYRAQLSQAGATESFIAHVLATPAGEIWYPTLDEMRQANIFTTLLDQN